MAPHFIITGHSTRIWFYVGGKALTFYRVQRNSTILYSQKCGRGCKRNSCTILYENLDGQSWYGQFLADRQLSTCSCEEVFASLSVIPNTSSCQQMSWTINWFQLKTLLTVIPMHKVMKECLYIQTSPAIHFVCTWRWTNLLYLLCCVAKGQVIMRASLCKYVSNYC